MKSPNILLSIVAAVTMTFGVSTSSVEGQGSCGGADTNGDGLVNGVDLAFLLSAWGVCPGTITSVTPLQGSILGGTQITINGTNLAGTTAVRISGVNCTNLQVFSPTLVKAVTPAGSAGVVDITVITPAGTLQAPNPFTYGELSISSISPNQGIYSGGTPITITGTFMNGATSVKVGGVSATNVVAVNSTTVTAVTPAGSVGAASVEVTGPKGTATASGAFTYNNLLPWATVLEQPPDPFFVPDANVRAAIVATGFPWRVRHVASQIEMLLVPAGNFGGIYTPQPFYLGRYEVKQSEWSVVMGSNPSLFLGPSRPVDRVTSNSIVPFLAATGLRLASAAEWEYACRAGTTTDYHGSNAFPNGTNDPNQSGVIAWTSVNSGGQTSDVGKKFPNGWGFFDMSGNIGEVVSDLSVAPVGGHVWKGGSYRRDPAEVTSGWWWCETCMGMAWEQLGFRAARNP